MLDLFMILAGAWLYRWRGMGHPKKHLFPRPFNQAVFALPYAIITAIFWWAALGWWALAVASVVWVLSTAGACTGHGRGMDLGDSDNGEPERLEFLISWLKPHVPLYWYDAALLSITGLAITLPAGIATINPVLGLSGILKGPAYMVAKFGDTRTEGGELLTGAVLWGCI
jgi:hypothetical protein|nr:MAG TPA: hypothetical protein [Caudoviricetes sp.]